MELLKLEVARGERVADIVDSIMSWTRSLVSGDTAVVDASLDDDSTEFGSEEEMLSGFGIVAGVGAARSRGI